MKPISLAVALLMPAAVVAQEAPCASLENVIREQARAEFRMITLQYPGPSSQEDPMTGISYLFTLSKAMREAATETATSITSAETAEAKAIELGARTNMYVELCMTVGIVLGLQAEKFSEEDIKKVDEMIRIQQEEDKILAKEFHRLKDQDFYGNAQLTAVMNYLTEAFKGNPAPQEPAATPEEEA